LTTADVTAGTVYLLVITFAC